MTANYQPIPNLERSCRGKNRYATEEMANSVAAKCFADHGDIVRVYPCHEDGGCGGFHLTSRDAEPRPGWRPPELSRRQQNIDAKAEHRHRQPRRRRDDY